MSNAKEKTLLIERLVSVAGENKRYVLFPSWVYSKNDNQRHYINAYELARLYGVELSQCVVVKGVGYGHKKLDGDIELYPNREGNYTLPL